VRWGGCLAKRQARKYPPNQAHALLFFFLTYHQSRFSKNLLKQLRPWSIRRENIPRLKHIRYLILTKPWIGFANGKRDDLENRRDVTFQRRLEEFGDATMLGFNRRQITQSKRQPSNSTPTQLHHTRRIRQHRQLPRHTHSIPTTASESATPSLNPSHEQIENPQHIPLLGTPVTHLAQEADSFGAPVTHFAQGAVPFVALEQIENSTRTNRKL
jgi:hypothetical protein